MNEVASCARVLGVHSHVVWGWACKVNSVCVRRALRLKRIQHKEVMGYCPLTSVGAFSRLNALLEHTAPHLPPLARFVAGVFVLFSLDAAEPTALPMSSGWLAERLDASRHAQAISQAVIDLTLKLNRIKRTSPSVP